MKYTHNEIRAFMADNANGTITEAALIAVKNLESAIYKRKALTEVERTACLMLIQCAEEIAVHIADKPIDNTRSMLPRELRDGLKEEIVAQIIQRKPARYNTEYAGGTGIFDKDTGIIWEWDTNGRLRRWC